ncbi:MAG: xanthine dehydrogenase accessory protein XdhC [Marinobacter sp.]|uniref:xanthine dehydrogenase accessory protein XdhC n=1 Tax=Marinobacter sp. TaxID=50741 RepID=UPI001B548E4B|nr:xanthine dehydrogenase accessory protein XdhC [Marinobacter sp.]MBQ0748369.1 xanthine dehydrogenase accessory protein XdhC [Marinobacter sp.]MBQ0812756.1 xanthine dehydrogenase accessory protein XdhC [Marinobacter sp.]
MDRRLNWYQAVALCEDQGEPYVLVTVLGVTGSVPREPSSKMVVTGSQSYDTIGGGHLEYRICQQARERLARQDFTSEMANFPLGASLGQCCGGSVSVLLEANPGCEQELVIFGAGHVAKALVTILGGLPWRITWVDERAEQFPADCPGNVRIHHTDDPVGDAPALCAGKQVLILTHNHQLDFELCRTLLTKGECAGIGLIGSDTKAERFRKRLDHRGFSAADINSIRCPVGRTDVPGKRPMEVAVSISAELLSLAVSPSQTTPARRGLPWKELKGLIKNTETGDISE